MVSPLVDTVCAHRQLRFVFGLIHRFTGFCIDFDILQYGQRRIRTNIQTRKTLLEPKKRTEKKMKMCSSFFTSIFAQRRKEIKMHTIHNYNLWMTNKNVLKGKYRNRKKCAAIKTEIIGGKKGGIGYSSPFVGRNRICEFVHNSRNRTMNWNAAMIEWILNSDWADTSRNGENSIDKFGHPKIVYCLGPASKFWNRMCVWMSAPLSNKIKTEYIWNELNQ